ncbi:MAG: hypothetical protein ACKO46_01850, partial [Alphaproteobacteria bacterium]
NYNLKLQEKSNEVDTYLHFSKVILINRKNPIPYVNIASNCNIPYLMNNPQQQNDENCPVTPNNIGMLNTENPNNQADFSSKETLNDSNPIIQNSSDPDQYVVLQNNGNGSCVVNLEVTNLEGSKKFIKFNNYSVSNVSSFANTDYYPSNSRLITLFTNSKLAVTSKTNCGDIFFKKFNFIEIRIMQTGFVNIKNITGQSCNLKARIINPSGEKCIKADLTPCATEYLYDNSISPATEQISHFFEYDSNFTSSSISIDPINNLSVTSTFSTDNIFVRKGQRIRILPETHQQDISFTHAGSSIAKKCGFGMFFKINPRPALMCFSAQSAETTKTPNPSCKENYGKYIPTFKMSITGSDPLNPDSIDSTATEVTMPPEGQIECSSTIDCTSEAELANSRTNLNTGKYCTSHEKCAPVDCSYNADGVPSCSDGTIDTQICNASYVSKNNPS